MVDIWPSEIHPPVMPPGLSERYLIEPNYLAARRWGLRCIADRLTFQQIEILLRLTSGYISNIYGLFGAGAERRTVSLNPTAKEIAWFFAEMVGGDVCVFDIPNSFLISVLEGDLTLVATDPTSLQKVCGSAIMARSDWIEIARGLRRDISDRILSKYTGAG